MAYKDISNYGIIGNMKTSALVGKDGSIDFMCYPRFDSPTIFSAMLDENKGGCFKIAPDLQDENKIQMYFPDTNVLLIRFLSSEGVCELTDLMPVSEKEDGNILIRSLAIIQGEMKISVKCAPRFNYARSGHRIENNDGEIKFVSNDGVTVSLKSSIPLEVKNGDVDFSVKMRPGDKLDIILYNPANMEGDISNISDYCNDKIFATINFWKQWVGRSAYKGNWSEIVNRSLLVLKLLTYRENGAFIASPTFSLPEEIGGAKNWDYRYVWIRDASFYVYNMIKVGYLKEASSFMNWLQNTCEDIDKPGSLRLMCTIDGKSVGNDFELSSLNGYKDSSPVRIGNSANQQLQLDIFGELMDAVYLYDKHVDFIPYRFWKNLCGQLNWLTSHWQEEDEGIWEVRGGKRRFLYSRVMCWVAFDRGIRLAERRSFPYPSSWKDVRDKIFFSVYNDFWNEKKQIFTQYIGSDNVDAASLLMPILRFISPKDPMWLSTLKTIENNLVTGSLVYRYRADEGLTGLHGGEGTFSMCTFWYIECLARSGQLEKARINLEKLLGYSNHLGIYSEQIGRRGEFLGNYPQALTHLGLLSAISDLDKRLDNKINKEIP